MNSIFRINYSRAKFLYINQLLVCLDAMNLACGFGFEGPNPNLLFGYVKKRWIWIWPKSIQDLRHLNPLISNSLTLDGICQILQLVSTFFFKQMLLFMFFFKLKLKSLLIPVLKFVSLNSSHLLKHLCLYLLSIVNLNRKILIELSKFICALVSCLICSWFVCWFWFVFYVLWVCIF